MTQEEMQILLVEDNPNDVKLTLHALREENLVNNIQVARMGRKRSISYSAEVNSQIAGSSIRPDWCSWT